MASTEELGSSIFTPQFIAEQTRELPILATTKTCSGATYIVTGANVGLGFETAKHLVQLGAAKVILAVRDVQAGENAKAEIEKETGKNNVLEVWAIDLASFVSIKAFAAKAQRSLERIDALVCNAAVALEKWSTAEGHETTITVNVLGTLLLGVLLVPKLGESGRCFKFLGHLVFVSSEASWTVQQQFDRIRDSPLAKLNDETIQGMEQRYPLSKLIQVFTVRHLAGLLPLSKTGVVINFVNPGFCKTDIARNYTGEFRSFVDSAQEQYGRTAEMGSRPILHAIVAGKESHGRYLTGCEIRDNEVPDWVTNEDGKQAEKHVWEDVFKVLNDATSGALSSIL
ncbi:uncharacterized protein A1O9_05319 [Exophiala aquamarina CBS 119918]|uniref:Alcohol dehydrogenase n=1 Tax=Exophiala aquamarina CBS 119918 TaxID=1182545 RepID=A0A072PCB5_9EURO|nr:uncharacterized protein A1O9_05319 [Exophiala aquamarina CBS 119918]KEF57402.1 hypothetical protein A1O9_05319 [Exophiala aquamarina CBS 119918]